jgi:unsaturated rhamnogalacturonyl hydrolase
MNMILHHQIGRWAWGLMTLCAFAGQSPAQGLPSRSEIVADMTLANDYFMAKWPDPTVDIVTDRARPSNIWTRSTYYEGLMALHGIDPKALYYNYAVQWAEGHNWEPAYGGTTTRNADNQCAGQTYLELYQIDPQPGRITPIKTTIDRMVNSTRSDDWWWIDAVHMAMPVFAKLGAILDDDSYFEKMYDLYDYTKTQQGGSGLYNPVDHLWWRDASFDPPYTAPNGEDTYWSRGDGWVFVALARVLDVLPLDAPHRAEYVTTFQEMAAALLPIQREDGFWNVSLHDPNDYGGPETSGTAMFTYGLSWGLNNGLLTGEQYLAAATNGWNAMVQDALHPNGFLGYVQSTGKQPSDGQPVTYDRVPNFEDYGLGAFLLAGSEVYQLALPEIPGDFNHDGRVDGNDFLQWQRGDSPIPLSGSDLADWQFHYGRLTGEAASASAAPEPATWILLLPALIVGKRGSKWLRWA